MANMLSIVAQLWKISFSAVLYRNKLSWHITGEICLYIVPLVNNNRVNEKA